MSIICQTIWILMGGLFCVTSIIAQNSAIPWSGMSGGFAISASGNTRILSAAGQPFVGTTTGGYSSVQSGFAAGLGTGGPLTLAVAVTDGWNMISVPVTPGSYAATSLFPTATTKAFAFQGSYLPREILVNGVGYWLRFGSPTTVSMSGTARAVDTVTVSSGWNMIGSISTPAGTSSVVSIPPGIVSSMYFGFSGGYTPAVNIQPGRAYWVKVNQNGRLVLRASGQSAVDRRTHEALDALNRLTIRDNSGNEQSLYFGSDPVLNLEYFEMPPPIPGGVFDARFASQRMIELAELEVVRDIPIVVSSAEYPVAYHWEIRQPGTASLTIGDRNISMGRSGSAIMAQAALTSLVFGGAGIPQEYALSQNYPNPFNPISTIRYDIPARSHMTLDVYDPVGRHITTLVDDQKEPGRYSARFDAGGLASGVYFYRMVAGSFVRIQKMILIR